uniref:DNA topoisomerase (ATP-hydrolyzing) n=1 Tax=Anopheles stephensi TaxID=30069 RepID=A0A182YKK2_ANOST
MASTSADFFNDCESTDDLFASSESSLLLPSSFTDLSSASDEYSTDNFPFESLAWDKNLVNLFNDFTEATTHEQQGTNTNTVTRDERQHDASTDLSQHLDASLHHTQTASSKRLFDGTLAERATIRTDNCLNSTVHNCSEPDERDHCNHVERWHDVGKLCETLHRHRTHFAHQHNTTCTGNTPHHTNTVIGTADAQLLAAQSDAECWNTDTQYSEAHDSAKDSGYDEPTATTTTQQHLTDATEVSGQHREIQARIIDLLNQIERSVNEGIPLNIRRKPRWETCLIEDGILQTTDSAREGRTIRPARTRRLQLMVKLLATIYQLLATGTCCTKRELYYLHLELAQTPGYTYAALDDICALLDADPWELNVFNTSKGLIAGPIVLTVSGGTTIDCGTNRWGTAVPLDVGSVVAIQLSARLVLVVEKDTVFKRLVEDGIFDQLLLKKIADWTKVPIYALMDADPHGIEIFCVYKFGSLAMVHQQQSLAVPSMRWIGLFPSDIELLGLQGVPLREHELKRIEQMVKRPYTEGHIQRELLLLRQLATKAEIESLYNIASDFITTVYLKGKFNECLKHSSMKEHPFLG